LFDPLWLERSGLITGHALAGRGSTCFLYVAGHKLVLRQYRRGGMVRHFNKRHYVWQGLEQTRAMREFELLRQLEVLGLPAPRPYACEVNRCGFLYTASLITRILPGHTLAEFFTTGDRQPDARLTDDVWAEIGICVRRFHDAGVWHADLNAHNILINGTQVALIDFDRACLKTVREPAGNPRRQTKQPGAQRWREANLQRLHRSLHKVAAGSSTTMQAEQWQSLISAYHGHAQ
jgi:3-deoxy-D-manno-octulosonic acid kinase